MIVGITGGVGSGKDEVCKILKRRGFLIIDADKIGHEILGGKVDRKKLGEVVFSDPKKLKLLNNLIHPLIKKEIKRLIKNRKLRVVSRKSIVINAALLKEIGLIPFCDEVWVVNAPRAERIKRLLKKGMAKKKISGILRSQMTQKEYLAIADKVIDNNGRLKDLKI